MKACKHLLEKIFFLSLLGALMGNTAIAGNWPQELKGDKGTIVVYQPQPEELKGNILTGRAAMSIEMSDNKDPVYGVFWFSAHIETDRNEDTATISDLTVTKVGWPDSEDAGEQQFKTFVEKTLSNSEFEISLSGLSASLTASNNVQQSLDDIKSDPPVILFREHLAVLLSYDGKPRYSAIENSPYERALNTPLAVVKDGKGNFYLTSGALWYRAKNALGPWHVTTTPPADLKAMIPEASDSVPAKAPEIVSVTEATELVVSDGAPEWTSLAGGKLLYVENTETPWLRDLASGDMYLQLSGRWFKAKSTDGPWTFVRPDKLPAGFKEIPPASDIGGLRSSVAGTEEADQAIVDAQMPQTAAINRSETKLTVEYDGDPKFEAIKGTDVAYAVNTATQVLRIDKQYYAVDNGVWFHATSATGPWAVADTIPSDKIADIPPSSPVYNTTYVTIYDSTPDVVYVGYTPGYMWSYPYYGVPVYGTGWYYPPYWGRYYYPRPPTWGLHVGYNPWTGWNVGVSWGGPFFRVGISWGGGYGYHRGCCGGYYGGGFHHNTNININTGDINIGNNVNIGNRANIGNKLDQNRGHDNLYKRKENQHRNASKATVRRDSQRARPVSDRKNNLYADSRGNVVRRDSNEQWQERRGGDWQSIPKQSPDRSREFDKQRPSTLPSSRPAPQHQRQQFNHQKMNHEYRARNMGGGGRVRGGRRR